jgi:hypothetical protein
MNTGGTRRFLSGSGRRSVIPYVHYGIVLTVRALDRAQSELVLVRYRMLEPLLTSTPSLL